MFIIKCIFNRFLEKEKENILCLGVMIGGNFAMLDKVYVITILNMDRGEKEQADWTFIDG